MFSFNSSPFGVIEVICGPMFSGKTEELIRRVKRAQIARLRVQIFKPTLDDRYHHENIVSHSSQSLEATAVKHSREILDHLYDSTRVVAIDEVQFFEMEVIQIAKKLAMRGVRVILAGLDQDYRGVPFGPMPNLLAIADQVDKVQAICTVCGGPATKSFRKAKADDQILVGEQDLYEARCPHHFEHPEEQLQNISSSGEEIGI